MIDGTFYAIGTYSTYKKKAKVTFPSDHFCFRFLRGKRKKKPIRSSLSSLKNEGEEGGKMLQPLLPSAQSPLLSFSVILCTVRCFVFYH